MNNNFFKTERLSPGTVRITDITGVCRFLITGRDSAVLVDTCTGVGNLREYVKGICSLPLSVILTHGHCDHVGGAAYFDKVYLSGKDLGLLPEHDNPRMKLNYVQNAWPKETSDLTLGDICPARTREFLPLCDGRIFDLGGIVLKAIRVPGHTQGMTCVLNITERSIIYGDRCNTAVFLFGEECLSVRQYSESLGRLLEIVNSHDEIYLSHPPFKMCRDGAAQCRDVCREIMAGTDDKVPFSFMDKNDIFLAKEVGKDMKRLDGKEGNIVYSRDNIF